MIKRTLFGFALTALLGTAVFGREAVSYFRTGFHNVRKAVRAEVPIEFEIERARTLVGQLDPDIRQCMHVVAEQQVDIEQLRSTLLQRESEIAKQKDAILTLKLDLGSGKTEFAYGGRTYNANELKRDLAARFERFKTTEEILSADRKILAARDQTLAANRDKLENMMQARKDLQLKLEQLEARIHTVKAAEVVSRLAVDDSNLGHARQLIVDLNKQLDVKQKMLDVEGKFVGLIPVEMAPPSVPEDLEKQIDDYLQKAPAVSVTTTK